jgi:hypothetical protein
MDVTRCERNVYSIGYVVTHGDTKRTTEGAIRILAASGHEAANAVASSFPGGWWSTLADNKDTLVIESVSKICNEIRLEVTT